jgi:hypothetical protein
MLGKDWADFGKMVGPFLGRQSIVKRSRLLARTLTALLSVGLGPHAVRATENGAIAWTLGSSTVLPGLAPDPGKTVLQDYTVLYESKKFANSNGGSGVPGFNLQVSANAGRILHTWETTLGPFQLTSGITIPFVNVNARSVFGSSNDFAPADITLEPLYLKWTNDSKTFFVYGGVNYYLPVGTAVSNNFYSVSPTVLMTWFPAQNFDISAVIGLEFHRKNSITDYQSGSLFFSDWGMNVRPFQSAPALMLGVGGYVVKQFTDDSLHDVVFADGFRQQGIGIGPQITYGTAAGAFAFKWQKEFATQNRPSGERYWFQFQVPIVGSR